MQSTENNSFEGSLGDRARSLDEQGRRVWQEHEREFRSAAKQAGYVVAVIVNLVVLYVANNLLAWNVPFLTSSFVAPLAVINISLLATVGAYLVFLVYDERWFRHFVQVGLNVIALGATYTLFIIFPFDFGTAAWVPVVRIALVCLMIAIGIGTIVEFVKGIRVLSRR